MSAEFNPLCGAKSGPADHGFRPRSYREGLPICFAEPVDAWLGGRVSVLGEPDERDGVVVDQRIDLEEVCELVCLAEAAACWSAMYSRSRQ